MMDKIGWGDLAQAAERRCSRRSYLKKPIQPELVLTLEGHIKECNEASGLNIQLMLNNGKAFDGLTKSYGLLSGVQNYIALVGKKADSNLKEKAGYYGEMLVLAAGELGLGTCWVGGTYSKKGCLCECAEDETLVAVITLGYVPEERGWKEGFVYRTVRRKHKTGEEMTRATEETPEWFRQGVRLAAMAPSALNAQPVTFHYDKGRVTATVEKMELFLPTDLGIAKLHFELGAGSGWWDWGNGADFHREA